MSRIATAHVHSALSGSSADVLAHRLPQVGQPLGEADEVVELRLLLLRPELRVVQVLAPAGAIDPGRLELRFRARRDPDVAPRGRDDQRLDALDLLGVGDLFPREST